MHQQVRTSTTKTPTGSSGPGAMADEGSLLDILTILDRARVNLQAAGGRDLDDGGEFAFAVHHQEGDDGPNEKAADLLERAGYQPRIVTVHSCDVPDEPGALLGCMNEAIMSQGDAYEIFVGTSTKPGTVPVQITSREVIQGRTRG